MQVWIGEHCIEGQAVLFDLDGTLVRSTGGIDEILTDWAQANGLDAATVLDFSHGKRTQDIVKHFKPEDWQTHYASLTAAFVAAAEHTIAMPAAQAFLQQLNAQHIPWAVVSSSERVLISARMRAAGLALPVHCVAAEDIQQGKPHPEGYLKAADILGVPIQHCIVFEDSDAGLSAGVDSGAQVIAIQRHDWQPHIQDYAEIRLL